ncbi:NurA domain protein [Pyrolobus fumarii 1A]|uniref:NurA domain protein n=1 Tax=Pyrolobus fumarii (strain DSM 11204 / 1A) TaxID=694429 RepID=G0EE71_PYRF1|nr:DNA double-strand break repair nuclease NurA [Pyrolobus fumarii]AEM38765.1 NurA domain protein [Pyrolobus fumarii 1A]
MAEIPGYTPHLVGEDIEEVDFGATQPVIVELLRSVPRHAERLAERVVELRKLLDSCGPLRSKLVEGIARISSESYVPKAGVAIDSTFPPEGGIDMVVGSLIGVVAGYLAYQGNVVEPRVGVYARLSIVEKQDEAPKVAAELSKMLERLVVLKKLLPKLPEDSVILIDGEVVPYTLLFTRISRPLKAKLDDVVSSMLREAESKRIMIVGVVKRSYTFLFSVYSRMCGVERLPLNDKTLASIVLQPGEYITLGSFDELLPDYARIAARRAPEKAAKIVAERLSQRPEYSRIIVAFYKPSGVPRSWQAVKVEVYAPWLARREAVEKAVSHLNTLTSSTTGLPYPIDMIDEYVRLEARALEVVRHQLMKHLAAKLVENGLPEDRAVLLTLHTNPEKRYLYQPRRR